jgi:hypothetical protein
MVGVQIARVPRRDGRAFVPDERLIDPGAVHVAAQQSAAAIVFSDQAVSVVDEPGDPRRRGYLVEPPERVVLQRAS